MNKEPIVCVLMSTYNGEKYLKEQLDSIFAQEDVKIKLVVRDDGSSDGTVKILENYPQNIRIIKAPNIGCEPSFMELIHLQVESDYYAFSDQDDIWMPKKLISAINNIQKYNVHLTGCNLLLVDSDGKGDRKMLSDKDTEYISYMMSKYVMYNAHGCTLVWTSYLHRFLQQYKPVEMVAHDTWVNSIANISGGAFLDNEAFIKYRIHQENVSGFASTPWHRLKKAYKLYWGGKKRNQSYFAKELLKGYSEMVKRSPEKYELLCNVSNYKKSIRCKFKLLTSGLINERKIYDRIFWWFLIILNRY